MLDVVDFSIHCCHPVIRVRRTKPLTSHLRVGVNVGCGPSNSLKGVRCRPCRCVGWLGVPWSHTHWFSDIPHIKCKAVRSKRWHNMFCIQPHLTTVSHPASLSCLRQLPAQIRTVSHPASLSCIGQLPAQIRMAGVTELSSATSVRSIISKPWLHPQLQHQTQAYPAQAMRTLFAVNGYYHKAVNGGEQRQGRVTWQ